MRYLESFRPLGLGLRFENTDFKTFFFQILIATALFLGLRWHPVTYDISRHIQLFSQPKEGFLQLIYPGVLSLKFLRYGVLSQLAPLSASHTVILFETLGGLSFLTLCLVSSLWSNRFLRSCWIGFFFVLIVSLLGPRHSLLFANHPYEIGLHFLMAAVLLAGIDYWIWAILFSCLAALIHPNLLISTSLFLVLTQRRTWLRVFVGSMSFSMCVAYYLVTGRC